MVLTQSRQNVSHGSMLYGGKRHGKTAIFEIIPKTDAEYEAAIDYYLGEMKQMQQQMKEERREVNTTRAEIDEMLTNIMQTLDAVQSR